MLLAAATSHPAAASACAHSSCPAAQAYRKAVLKSQAAEFFAIRPKAKAWVLKAGMGIKKPRKMAA